MKGTRFVGDCPLMVMTKLNDDKVRTESEAQKIIDELVEFVGWDKKVKVFYEMKNNKRSIAHYAEEFGEPVIRVKSLDGRNVGTLIHELAHHKVRGHSKQYKLCQQMLIISYLKMKKDKRYNLLVGNR